MPVCDLLTRNSVAGWSAKGLAVHQSVAGWSAKGLAVLISVAAAESLAARIVWLAVVVLRFVIVWLARTSFVMFIKVWLAGPLSVTSGGF